MDQLLFQDWLTNQNFQFPIFMMRMPDNPDRATSFVITEGVESRGSVDDLVLNFYVRSEHPANAIEECALINKALNYRTNIFLGDTQIILIKSQSVVPTPLGIDENNRHVFQMQFKMLTSFSDKTQKV